jgi:hypothetical protein
MSTPTTPPPYGQQAVSPAGGPQPGQAPQQAGGYAPMPGVPTSVAYGPPTGPLGRLRPTGMTILLVCVTLGIWSFIYYYQTQEEMRRHSGQGLGGVLALVIALFFGIVSPFILSHEVGQLYERQGHPKPVSALTGLWFFPGMLILVGPFIWFIRTNRALNEYWQGFGVTETTLA